MGKYLFFFFFFFQRYMWGLGEIGKIYTILHMNQADSIG